LKDGKAMCVFGGAIETAKLAVVPTT